MARDRKRAKQRQQRRARAGALPSSHETHHENVPGSLEHSSGEVEEFDAALIAGADGEVAEADGEIPPPAGEIVPPDGDLARADGEVIAEDGGLTEADLEDDALARTPSAPTSRDRGGGTLTARRAAPVAREARAGGENRVVGFLRASWAELQRVQWPDRRQVAQATAVVLGFVAVAGVYLGVADWLAGKIVNAIL